MTYRAPLGWTLNENEAYLKRQEGGEEYSNEGWGEHGLIQQQSEHNTRHS